MLPVAAFLPLAIGLFIQILITEFCMSMIIFVFMFLMGCGGGNLYMTLNNGLYEKLVCSDLNPDNNLIWGFNFEHFSFEHF